MSSDTCSRCGSTNHYICGVTLDEDEAQTEAQIASLQAQLAEKEKKIQGLLGLIRLARQLPFYKDLTEDEIRKVMDEKRRIK